ncbi:MULTISPECIES: 3-hydroxyacyl-CoA dehydrogenase NAD-binding domain-containing protein [Vitreoscilla]|uniref:3-hydroxyacyl-CoA dehydrogenase NAD-binding domain-containing protein n=1 Tax=Vitreoscilla stercoraria TaxID=61 RepID=A0ABY4EC32_VITST|nr:MULTISPECIES: 3-hydroxyacyl-CoA dehydrogenase NAD-binding domain-containing protein [Vitreoscilla]QJQ52361.1 3-hydroxyacyl-CoA dehydrogenase [Vitreoscilla sp. C1]UOO92908.1 3-hydroxyacyl-CoA dehydrogenase NAD-binding domain-containing protein [Vitreoscilla stercoraria]
MQFESIKTVAIVGCGVIGASWAAFYLAKGFDVVAYDPAEGAQQRLQEWVNTFWQDLSEMGLVAGASLNRLRFETDLSQAVQHADFVQENGPERLELKQALYTQMDAAAPTQAIFASSSSGLKISDIQSVCQHPERVVLGHPFNPPHLLPLVEVIGGAQTDAAVVEQTMAFYQSLGKKAIRIHKEVPGHVANRLQAALWREAFYLVEQGVCSAQDVDTAITAGPGLRWALLGPYLNMQLANNAGFAHAMEHLGPPMTSWWNDLGSVTVDEALIDTLDTQVGAWLESLGGVNLRQERDTALLGLLKLREASQLP